MQKSCYLYYIRCCCTRIDLSNHTAAPNSPQQIPLQEKKAAVDTVLKTGRRTEKGGRWALKPWLLAWHGSPFNSPCKVFTISLSVASLSRKWGQRITWRGGKGSRSGKAFVWRMANLSPSPSQGRKVFFFLSFLLLNPQSLVSYSGGRWRKGRRKRGKNEKKKQKKNVRPFAGPEPFQMWVRLLFLQPCHERSPN